MKFDLRDYVLNEWYWFGGFTAISIAFTLFVKANIWVYFKQSTENSIGPVHGLS